MSGFASPALHAADGVFTCHPLQQIRWERLSDGVEWAKYDLAFTPYDKEARKWSSERSRSVTVRVFRADLTQTKLVFHRPAQSLACDPGKGERYIDLMIRDMGREVIGGINANFFVMPRGGILGLAIDEEKSLSLDLSNLTISSAGVFGFESGSPFLETRDRFVERFGNRLTREDAARFSFAVQAYPRLLVGGELQISDSVANMHVSRTSIGMGDDLGRVLLVTIDARGWSPQTGMTLYEYAHMLRDPSCGVGQKLALNLDGGGSTSFAIPSLKIYEQVDRCRNLGDILTVIRR